MRPKASRNWTFPLLPRQSRPKAIRANFSIELSAGQQLILPNFVQYLRDRGIAGIGQLGTNYVGALFATIEGDTTESMEVESS